MLFVLEASITVRPSASLTSFAIATAQARKATLASFDTASAAPSREPGSNSAKRFADPGAPTP